MDDKKDLINLHTSVKGDEFIIHGCGIFRETKKVLNKTEAALLYVELHKFLNSNKTR